MFLKSVFLANDHNISTKSIQLNIEQITGILGGKIAMIYSGAHTWRYGIQIEMIDAYK